MSYYDYLKKNEHRYNPIPIENIQEKKGDAALPSVDAKNIDHPTETPTLSPPEKSVVFNQRFTKADFRTVVRAWRLKNGFPIESEIKKITN